MSRAAKKIEGGLHEAVGYAKGWRDGIEHAAQTAEHLNGWGNAATRASGLADHIAKVIRSTPPVR